MWQFRSATADSLVPLRREGRMRGMEATPYKGPKGKVLRAPAMRFRLRTLLIAITAACIYLAWVGFCHRMARFYREQSSQILLQMVEQDGRGRTREWAESKVS